MFWFVRYNIIPDNFGLVISCHVLVIVMPTLFQALDRKTTDQQKNKTKNNNKKSPFISFLIFHCLTVV